MVSTSETVTEHPKMDPDIELVRLCAQGNVDAFGELVARHERAVYSVVSRMVGSRDLASQDCGEYDFEELEAK